MLKGWLSGPLHLVYESMQVHVLIAVKRAKEVQHTSWACLPSSVIVCNSFRFMTGKVRDVMQRWFLDCSIVGILAMNAEAFIWACGAL